jgi:hypothetical protein
MDCKSLNFLKKIYQEQKIVETETLTPPKERLRPSTLVILYPLLQNGIFLPRQQNSHLYIHFSHIQHTLYLHFIPTTLWQDPLVILLIYLPPSPSPHQPTLYSPPWRRARIPHPRPWFLRRGAGWGSGRRRRARPLLWRGSCDAPGF